MNSKIFKLLLSVVLAFVLWSYVVTAQRTDTEQTFYNVPVVLDGESVLEDRGLKLTSDKELTVTLRLSGNRSQLNQLRSSDITVLVDLSRITEAGEKAMKYTVSFPGDIQDSAVEVVSREPAEIKLQVEEWDTKQIPVKAELPGELPENYIIDQQNVSLEYESVTISGPKDLVDQISMAKVVVNMDGRTESVEERVNITLCDENGQPVEDVSTITPDPYRVLAKVPVLMVKELQLQVPILEGGGLTAEDVELTVEYNTITVSGTPAVIAGLGDSLTLTTIDLGQENESFTDREYPVSLPEGIRNTSGVESVRVSLTLPLVKVQEFRVRQIDYEGLADGMKAEIATAILSVWIRGRETVLEKVSEEDIHVTVDLTGITQSGYYPATVTVEGHTGVGVVSNPGHSSAEYVVYVKLTKQDTSGA